VNNTACNGNELWKNISLLFSCLSAGGAWYTQRSAVGENTDSHDDFRPVHRDSVSVPSVYELIEQVKTLKPIIVMVTTTDLGPQVSQIILGFDIFCLCVEVGHPGESGDGVHEGGSRCSPMWLQLYGLQSLGQLW
jgi:hypothetical protein